MWMSSSCDPNYPKWLDRLPKVSGIGGDVQLSKWNGLRCSIYVRQSCAAKRQDTYISSEIFLLAAIEDKGPLGQLTPRDGPYWAKSLSGAIEQDTWWTKSRWSKRGRKTSSSRKVHYRFNRASGTRKVRSSYWSWRWNTPHYPSSAT